MKKSYYDVVIIGGGPAGSTAAKELTEKGNDVVIVDKQKFPRKKACGGGITQKSIERFPYIKDINVIESGSYISKIYSSSLKKEVDLEKSKPIISMIQREKFDNELVKLAVKQGAEFRQNTSIENIKLNEKTPIITLSDSTTLTASIIIGADGVFSSIAKKAGLVKKQRFLGVSVLEEFIMDSEIIKKHYTDKFICYIHHKFDDISGYGWVFPKKNMLNIGVVDYRPINRSQGKKIDLKQTFNNYLNMLKKYNLLPNSLESNKLRGGFLPFHPVEKTYDNNILLCGDAAGFINPLTGEGIYYALASGKIAGKVAAKSIEENDNSKEFLSQYETLWKKEFGKEIIKMIEIAKKYGQQSEKFIDLLKNNPLLLEMLF